MNRYILSAAVVTAALAAVAWSYAAEQPEAGFQPKAYFQMPLEKDPSRQVRLQSVVIPPGAGNQFHRHPGDQWWAVQEGEVTYTIKGQPPRVLKPGDYVYVPPRHGSSQSEPDQPAGTLNRVEHHRQGQAADRAGALGANDTEEFECY